MGPGLLITTYKGGFRFGETGLMKWGNLEMDGTCVVVYVTFKTAKDLVYLPGNGKKSPDKMEERFSGGDHS